MRLGSTRGNALGEGIKMTYRVLVVDDDKEIRDVLQNLLEMRGHEVVTAADGMAAVTAVGKYRPDLMILDVTMPRMSGFQTCQAIRRMKGYSEIPVVFLTAKKSEKDKEFGSRIGGDVYLTKPYNQNELMHVVEKLLHERGNPDEARGDVNRIREDTSFVD